MAVRDPKVMPLHDGTPVPGTRTHEWFEIRLDECTLQKRLPCLVDGDGTFWIEPQVWSDWQAEVVGYFTQTGYTGPQIEAFIKDHALGGSGKVGRS